MAAALGTPTFTSATLNPQQLISWTHNSSNRLWPPGWHNLMGQGVMASMAHEQADKQVGGLPGSRRAHTQL